MLFINDFLDNFIDMIDKPIVRGNKQGFYLSNGMKIYFK